jgi:uncharacterized membrane protein
VDTAVPLLFRFFAYTCFGLVMETIFAIDGIERLVGSKIPRRVPKKYLEGFVSAYMIPLHGLGVLFLLEPVQGLMAPFAWPIRYCAYAVGFTFCEIAWGWILDKTLGFYPWDYYELSRWKICARGYSLWTLVPMWGLIGMVLERYCGLMCHLAPLVAAFYGYPAA